MHACVHCNVCCICIKIQCILHGTLFPSIVIDKYSGRDRHSQATCTVCHFIFYLFSICRLSVSILRTHLLIQLFRIRSASLFLHYYACIFATLFFRWMETKTSWHSGSSSSASSESLVLWQNVEHKKCIEKRSLSLCAFIFLFFCSHFVFVWVYWTDSEW